MRTYRIDDLQNDECQRLVERFHELECNADIEDLYWLPVPQSMLSDIQKEHQETCAPYVMALEIIPGALSLEMLVRSRTKLRCDCVHYASPELQIHMITYLHELLEELDIHV